MRLGNGSSTPAGPTLLKKADYDKLSAYFNLDNGTGKIRGVYLQGNEAVAPIFREWMEPFRSLGMTTLSIRNTASTDHVPAMRNGCPQAAVGAMTEPSAGRWTSKVSRLPAPLALAPLISPSAINQAS